MQNNLHYYPNLVSVRKAICTQYELAEKIGISQQEISRYERGEIKAPINYILDLALVCDVSVDYILGISGKTTNLLSKDEALLLDLFQKLSKQNQIRLHERAKTYMNYKTNKILPPFICFL